MWSLFANEGAPLFAWDKLWDGLAQAAAFGFLGIVLLIVGYWLFDLITPKIDVQKELLNKNMAVATVVAALLLGIAFITAQVIR
jgi:putative membrane protein